MKKIYVWLAINALAISTLNFSMKEDDSPEVMLENGINNGDTSLIERALEEGADLDAPLPSSEPGHPLYPILQPYCGIVMIC